MEIPIIYRLSHYVLGALSVKYSFIAIIFLLYQFSQWYLNLRFFLLNLDCYNMKFDKCFKSGNSINHTLKKIGEFIAGYIVCFAIILHISKNYN